MTKVAIPAVRGLLASVENLAVICRDLAAAWPAHDL